MAKPRIAVFLYWTMIQVQCFEQVCISVDFMKKNSTSKCKIKCLWKCSFYSYHKLIHLIWLCEWESRSTTCSVWTHCHCVEPFAHTNIPAFDISYMQPGYFIYNTHIRFLYTVFFHWHLLTYFWIRYTLYHSKNAHVSRLPLTCKGI